jgi:ankyrin repeat protein
MYDIKDIYRREGHDEALQAYPKVIEENKNDEKKMNALAFLAADRAHSAALKLLFEAGVSPMVTDDNGCTLLHHLALRQEGSSYEIPAGAITETTAFLLENKVSALKKDTKEGMTCYHYAARRGAAEMVEALAKHGVKLNMTDKSGSTGIHLACMYAGSAIGRIDSTKRSLDMIMKNYEATANRMKAAGRTDEQIAQSVRSDPFSDPDRAQKEYDNAVQLVEDYFLTVKAFAQNGVDVDDKNSEGKSALDIAIGRGVKKIAAYLAGTLDENADDAGAGAGAGGGNNAAIIAGGMTLHQAAAKGDAEAIQIIAAGGADLNGLKDGKEQEYGGCTPLAVAVAHMKDNAVDALLSCGADPSFKDGKGRVALYYLFLPDISSSLNEGTYKEKRVSKMIGSIISAGFELNQTVDDEENTLLLLACKMPDKYPNEKFSIKNDAIDELMKRNCDINKNNRFGETALMHTGVGKFSQMENVQIYLLERGADVHAADKNGDTALHYAARHFDKAASKALCEMLLAFDADAKAANNAQKTPLDLAVEKNNEPLAKMLLNKM